VVLARWMQAEGIELIDSQVHTEHLERFGAKEWSRQQYLERLTTLVDRPTRRGKWSITAENEAFAV
jgi:leucyl/phenylalanyl-tRNA--protein transferase